MVFLLASITTYGCALHRVNLVDNGTVILELAPSDDWYVSQAYVFQDDDEMLISGKIERTTHSRERTTHSSLIHQGHVDIALIAQDGTVVHEVSASNTPTSLHRIATTKMSFSVRLKIVPTKGTKIRMTYRPY
jgi:hypothetical protein